MLRIKKHKHKKLIISLVIIVGLILAAGATYMFLAKPFSKKETPVNEQPVGTINYNPATSQEKKDSEKAKEHIVQQEQQQNQTPSNVTVTISRASQADSGQPLNVRTVVGGAQSGTCSITLTNNGQTVSKTANIALNVNTYSCNIDIPASEFPSNGTWNLRIIATSGTSSSAAATQTITITK